MDNGKPEDDKWVAQFVGPMAQQEELLKDCDALISKIRGLLPLENFLLPLAFDTPLLRSMARPSWSITANSVWTFFWLCEWFKTNYLRTCWRYDYYDSAAALTPKAKPGSCASFLIQATSHINF